MTVRLCPDCKLPRPCEWCWAARDNCPLNMPPRWLERPEAAVPQLYRRIVALEEEVKALKNPPCCAGGPQWGHAWDCKTLP